MYKRKQKKVLTKKMFILLLSACAFMAAFCLVLMCLEFKMHQNAENVYQAVLAGNEGEQRNKEEKNIQPAAYEAPDFEKLKDIFPDTVGWIRSEDGILNYPVVQSKDNTYYMEHLANGQKNALGAIFLDYNNEADFSSSVSILYGHHVKNEMMFGFLDRYKEQEYYDKNPSLYLFTKDGSYTIDLIAACLFDGTTGSYPKGFANEAQMETYLDKIQKVSLFKSQYEIKSEDKLIILSTCSYEFKNARLAVMGFLREFDFSQN